MRALTSIAVLACLTCACSVDPKPAPSPATTLSNVPDPAITPPAAVAPTTPVSPAAMDNAASGRDPFAPPTTVTVAPPPPRDDVPRKARKYSLEQLKLVAIVSGDESRAMLIDPRGKGWIVSRGDHVGRPELVVDHNAGWRVQKIKNEEIVFVREDATRNDRTAETRVLALHADTAAQPHDDADD